MFHVDTTVPFLRATREQVLQLAESINHPVVAVPGKLAQIAQAFVVTLRNPGGSLSVHIHLWLTETREGVFYSYDRRQLSPEQQAEAEADALAFCESMGFMLDNLAFQALPASQQDDLLRRLPPFQRDSSRVAAMGGGNLGAQAPATPPAGVQVPPAQRPPAPSTLAPATAALLTGAPTASPDQLSQLGRLLGSF